MQAPTSWQLGAVENSTAVKIGFPKSAEANSQFAIGFGGNCLSQSERGLYAAWGQRPVARSRVPRPPGLHLDRDRNRRDRWGHCVGHRPVDPIGRGVGLVAVGSAPPPAGAGGGMLDMGVATGGTSALSRPAPGTYDPDGF